MKTIQILGYFFIFAFSGCLTNETNKDIDAKIDFTSEEISALTKIPEQFLETWELDMSSNIENYENISQYGYQYNGEYIGESPPLAGRPTSLLRDLVDIWSSGTYWRVSAGRRNDSTFGKRAEVRQNPTLINNFNLGASDRLIEYTWLYSLQMRSPNMYNQLSERESPNKTIIGQIAYNNSNDISFGGGKGGMWTLEKNGTNGNYEKGLKYSHTVYESEVKGRYVQSGVLLSLEDLDTAESNNNRLRMTVKVNYSNSNNGHVEAIAEIVTPDGNVIKSRRQLIYENERNLWSHITKVPYWKGGLYKPEFWKDGEIYTIRIRKGSVKGWKNMND